MKNIKKVSTIFLVSIVCIATFYDGTTRTKAPSNSYQSISSEQSQTIFKNKEEIQFVLKNQISITEDTERGYFLKNENGEAYGTFINYSDGEIIDPELIEAVGKDNVEGYVKYIDLHGENNVYNPDDPIKTKSIPLYKKDGTTVIGEFIIDNSVAEIE